jgi:hypothetical protein
MFAGLIMVASFCRDRTILTVSNLQRQISASGLPGNTGNHRQYRQRSIPARGI